LTKAVQQKAKTAEGRSLRPGPKTRGWYVRPQYHLVNEESSSIPQQREPARAPRRPAGDDVGVMVLPREQAVGLANRVMDVLEKENRLRGEIDAGKTLAEVAYLQKWERAR
jgi:hypothetical protein